MTIKAIIRGNDYLFMTRFASNEENRYYLKGVSVEPLSDTSVILAATTGSVLGCMRLNRQEGDAYGAGDKFILAADKALIRAVKVKKNDNATIVCREDRVDVYVTSFAAPQIVEIVNGTAGIVPIASFPVSNMYIDGTFPNWRKVIPAGNVSSREGKHDTNAVYCSGIDPDLLALFRRDNENPAISFDWDGVNPILVTNADERFLGVVMPHGNGMTRDSIIGRKNWLLAEIKAQEAA